MADYDVVRATLSAASGGTTDFASAGKGTVAAAIILASNANSTNNPQAGGALGVGFWDGTNQRAVGVGCEDNVATTNTVRSSNDAYGLVIPAVAGAVNQCAYTVSAITDGIRLTLSEDNTTLQIFCTVLLFYDVPSKTLNFSPHTTLNSTQESASLGFAPKVVFFITAGSGTVDLAGSATACFSLGVAGVGIINRTILFGSADAQAVETANILFSESRCVGQVSNNSYTWSGEMTTLGADTFTMTTRTATPGTDVTFALALGGDVSFDIGTLTTRTSAGDDVIATDIPAAALLICLSTSNEVEVLENTPDFANCLMIGMANAATEFSHNISVEDDAGTTNANSAAQAAAILDLDSSAAGARTDLCDATVVLNPADFTLSYSLANATARKGWWVAFGQPPSSKRLSLVSMSQAVHRAASY